MRILLVCTKYPVIAGDSYLTSELAAGLVRAGHSVDVVLLDWDHTPNARTENLVHDGIRVLRIAPRAWQRLGTLVYRASKFLLSGGHAAAETRKALALDSYDACIAWMPATPLANILAAAKRANIPARILFIWDFYPVHHREIGLIPPGPVYAVAKWLEERAMAHCSAFMTMLPSNRQYLRDHYRIGDQAVSWTPIWTNISQPEFENRTFVRDRYGLPLDRPIAIFGGQITEGRGIELIIEAAQKAKALNSDVLFLFVGSGRLVDQVKNAAQTSTNIRHINTIPRSDYLALLASADIGLVATVPGVTSHTFPSKTLDYLRLSVPIVAAVESGNDYLAMIDNYRIGLHSDFDSDHFADAVISLSEDSNFRDGLARRANLCLKEMFDVSRAVSAIEAIS